MVGPDAFTACFASDLGSTGSSLADRFAIPTFRNSVLSSDFIGSVFH